MNDVNEKVANEETTTSEGFGDKRFEEQRKILLKLIFGVLFEIFIPVVFVILLYFPLKYINTEAFVFDKVFSGADLILISALLLLTTANEINYESHFHELNSHFVLSHPFLLAAAIIGFPIFALCKYFYIIYTFPTDPNLQISNYIHLFSILSIGSICVAALTAITCKIMLTTKRLKKFKG